jgi:hypothetical protein
MEIRVVSGRRGAVATSMLVARVIKAAAAE